MGGFATANVRMNICCESDTFLRYIRFGKYTQLLEVLFKYAREYVRCTQ